MFKGHFQFLWMWIHIFCPFSIWSLDFLSLILKISVYSKDIRIFIPFDMQKFKNVLGILSSNWYCEWSFL